MASILNKEELSARGRSDLRRTAIEIANAGLTAVDPGRAVRSKVTRSGDSLVVDGRVYSLGRPIHVLGAGKATIALAAALEELLGQDLVGGLVVVPSAHETPLSTIEVLAGDHPIPGHRSMLAGERMAAYADAITPGSLVICTFTGGSSALVSMPPVGVSAEAKTALHELLVTSGIDVVKMNTIRKHVSGIKGGRLAHRLSGSEIVNLTLSDVAGDVLDAITDLTIQDSTRRLDAVRILEETGLWDHVDESIRAHLHTEDAESPWLEERTIHTVLVANGETATEAMLGKATALGLRGVRVSGEWGGDAASYGRHLAALAESTDADVLVGCGGETTVRLEGWGAAGKGGPNQELAVAAALAFGGRRPAALIALDTDGSDGASRYAGGLVDDLTAGIWTESGVEINSFLTSHESTVALETIGQAVDTGPTLTNVNDLFVVVVGG